jgi:hypothetical protein
LQSLHAADASDALRDTRRALVAQLEDVDAMSIVARAATAALRTSRDAFDVHALIGDVVADTYSGDTPYDPDQSMATHMIGEVRRRVARSQRATKKLVSLDSITESLASDQREVDIEAAHGARLDRLERALPMLRARVSDDPALARMLAQHEAGAARSAAVVRDGMTRGEYSNARRRLIAAAQAVDRAAQVAQVHECTASIVDDDDVTGNTSVPIEVPLTDEQRAATLVA